MREEWVLLTFASSGWPNKEHALAKLYVLLTLGCKFSALLNSLLAAIRNCLLAALYGKQKSQSVMTTGSGVALALSKYA
jgi:hypothetical protein